MPHSTKAPKSIRRFAPSSERDQADGDGAGDACDADDDADFVPDEFENWRALRTYAHVIPETEGDLSASEPVAKSAPFLAPPG